MKIRIDVKWLIAAIVLIAGISIAASYPILGDPDSYFGFIHGDCGNCSNIPAAQIVGNFTQRVNFTNTLFFTSLVSGTGDAVCINPTTKEIQRNEGADDCSVSSKSLKANIETVSDSNLPISNFNTLKPVQFTLKDDPKKRERLGLIAEDIAPIYPQAVVRNDKNEITGIAYIQFIPILIEKIQAQDEIINQQSIMMNRQAEAINALQNEIKMSGNGTALTPLPTAAPKEGGFWSWLFG